MSEIWLRPNRRALCFGMIVPGLLVAVGAAVVGLAAGTWMALIGWLFVFGGLALIAGLTIQLFRPRVAYESGHVLFYLRTGSPVRAPIEIVEAFYLGKGPAMLMSKNAAQSQTVNLVARLAERASQSHRASVMPALGQWCDGYVTIRGTWCEPLTEELVRRLNRQLSAAKKTNSANKECRP